MTAVIAVEIPGREARNGSDFRVPYSPSNTISSPPWTIIENASSSDGHSVSESPTTSAEWSGPKRCSSLGSSSSSSYIMVAVHENDDKRPSEQVDSSTASSSTKQVQLLFSKSKVYVHPTLSSKDNIPGFLAMVRPKDASDLDILLAWIPESVIESDDYNSYVKVELDPETNSLNSSTSEVFVAQPTSTSISPYAFSIPLRNLYSLQVKPPSLGLWRGSVVAHTRTEETLSGLFFHDSESESTILIKQNYSRVSDPIESMAGNASFWGGSQFLRILNRYATLEKSTLDPSIVLVNPRPEVGTQSIDYFAKPVPDTFVKTLDEAKWTLLEKLAEVTRISRQASQSIIDNSPAPIRKLLSQPEVKKIGDDFGSARYYLARWAMGIAEEARERSGAPRRVWKEDGEYYQDFLSSYYTSIGNGFEFISGDEFDEDRRKQISSAEWEDLFDSYGKLKQMITVDHIKERIFHGGVDPSIRTQVWLFLLEVYPWDSTTKERALIAKEKRKEYDRLKRQWSEDKVRQKTDDFWKDQKWRIEKDVYRTDRDIELFQVSDLTPHPDGPESRFANVGTNKHLENMKNLLITYNEYNVNLGYVQGMSDLLSPLYVTFQEGMSEKDSDIATALAFATYCQFMCRMERNFLRDQSGMWQQMLTLDHLTQLLLPNLYTHLQIADSTNFFFFFRMLLVWYKREFCWDSVLRLWESLWTDYLSSQFVIFLGVALLELHQDNLIKIVLDEADEGCQFDEILKYMNDLALQTDVNELIVKAEQVFTKFKRTVELIDSQQPNEQHNGNASEENKVVVISDELRQLLSRTIIVVKESKRPANAGGG